MDDHSLKVNGPDRVSHISMSLISSTQVFWDLFRKHCLLFQKHFNTPHSTMNLFVWILSKRLNNINFIAWFKDNFFTAVEKLSLNHAIQIILFNLYDKMRQIAYSRIQDLSTIFLWIFKISFKSDK